MRKIFKFGLLNQNKTTNVLSKSDVLVKFITVRIGIFSVCLHGSFDHERVIAGFHYVIAHIEAGLY